MTTALVNRYSATVKGGFFAQYSTSVAGIALGGGSARRRVARELASEANIPLREAMLTLNGATTGSAMSATRARIAAATELGGRRTIETVTLIDANSASGDKTRIDSDVLAYGSYDSTPVANGDGNPLGTR